MPYQKTWHTTWDRQFSVLERYGTSFHMVHTVKGCEPLGTKNQHYRSGSSLGIRAHSSLVVGELRANRRDSRALKSYAVPKDMAYNLGQTIFCFRALWYQFSYGSYCEGVWASRNQESALSEWVQPWYSGTFFSGGRGIAGKSSGFQSLKVLCRTKRHGIQLGTDNFLF
jgi:hypothetical protein